MYDEKCAALGVFNFVCGGKLEKARKFLQKVYVKHLQITKENFVFFILNLELLTFLLQIRISIFLFCVANLP